jgi:hypothetical protein
MSQIVIETDTIKKAVFCFFAIVGITIIGCMVGMSIFNHYINQQAQQTVVPVAVPATVPAPTVVPTSAYPTIIEFTVLSTTIANGHYTVYTTTGQTLYMPDFNSWNALLPQNSYAATITGAESNGALDVGSVNIVSTPPTYPVYYHYNLNYYQYDGHTVLPIAWKETIGHRVIEGRPPYLP